MGPVSAIKTGLSRITDFDTRSSRSEYWWMFAFVVIVVVAFQAVAMTSFGVTSSFKIESGTQIPPDVAKAANRFFIIFNLSLFVICFFMLPVTARRFKDHGWRGGWFKWAWRLNFISLAGVAFLIFWMASGRGTTVPPGLPALFIINFIAYASVIWMFWIGFVRPDPNGNDYGPNPTEVNP